MSRPSPKTLRQKAHSARRGHSNDDTDRGRPDHPYSMAELEGLFGWTLDAMVSLFEQAIELGVCPDCRAPYRNYGAALTIDIIDPTLPPYWDANTRAICSTCNARKRSRTSVEMAVRRAEAERAALVTPGQLAFEL